MLNREVHSGIGRGIVEANATVHISEAKLVHDPRAVLAKVQEDVEIVIELDHRPVAELKGLRNRGVRAAACGSVLRSQRHMRRNLDTLLFPMMTLGSGSV